MPAAESHVQEDATRLVDTTAFRVLARSGYAVNGLLHILIGGIAIGVAFGARHAEADQSGALKQVAQTPGGDILLWLLVVGLLALGLWQLVQLVLVPHEDPAKRWGKRASDLGKAIAYIAIAATTFTFARGGSSSSAKSTETLSAKLISAPGGVFVVVVIGLVIISIGGFFVYRGVSRTFKNDISLPGGKLGDTIETVGVAGYIAKGIALLVVGALFVVAGFTADAKEASGLDGALKVLASLPFGTIILTVVGIGLIAYGLYCGARARLAKL
jgi:hypothetical protein